MSVKVPNESVEYQYKTYNKCQCEFCNSRRLVGAKHFAVSQRAGQMGQQGCNCGCHAHERTVNTFLKKSTFDPDYPQPVNQTELNRSRGRNGVPAGNAHTIKNRSTKATPPATNPTQEENEAALAELDRLERLLIEEHKARVKETMEAERTRSGQSGRPVPLPKDYQPQYTRDSNPCEVDYGMSDSNQTTKVEAYPCPATPPVQCNASHQLQDTLDLIREVTRDPANPESYEMLKRLANGEPVQRSAPADKNASSKKKENEFGDSLAKNVRSGYRPVGSGLVWTV